MDSSVAAFVRVLDPEDRSTGGGTASALAGAMAAALVAMVAHLSIGKEGMEPDEFYRELGAEAESLSGELLNGGCDDTRAFEALRAAYRLPKGTQEHKYMRAQAIQQATVEAAQVPLANAERCRRVLEMCARLRGHFNLSAVSDLECAELLARAGLLGCVANVRVNVPSIRDQQVAADLEGRAQALCRWDEPFPLGSLD